MRGGWCTRQVISQIRRNDNAKAGLHEHPLLCGPTGRPIAEIHLSIRNDDTAGDELRQTLDSPLTQTGWCRIARAGESWAWDVEPESTSASGDVSYSPRI